VKATARPNCVKTRQACQSPNWFAIEAWQISDGSWQAGVEWAGATWLLVERLVRRLWKECA